MQRLIGLIAILALVSCGSQQAAAPTPTRYQASLTVLEGGGHGPQLCDMVQESLPPQCGGPDVVGWDWDKVDHESLNGVKWGSYRVVGTWDGARLTLTEPPGEPVKPADPDDADQFASACPEPQGGWRPVDPGRTTERTMQKAMDRARTAKEFAGAWIDRIGPQPEKEEHTDALRYVVNLKFTGDLAGREAWIREVWGGALCVSGAQRTEAELHAIQREIDEELGGEFISSSPDTMRGLVRVGVWVATEDLRRRLEDTYGKDAVLVSGVLEPVSRS
ncbi:hypothetical protein SAMN05444920_103185 [Nonomuraea solani]|uniref:Sporulation related domain-containing protein n=1 Tax=Nonomuraea solani TaxID=1144553 RepID=A0A1H6B7Z6_9ACTN|nr:hypothetical protein [Nonomuraea solani]SEG56327.1 hypothetical protein SAMN05444920_103185 [Nonomuraea solani]